MIETVKVAGASGRVGSAVSARLRERGVGLVGDDADLVLLCVPDERDLGRRPRRSTPGPWIAHTSGATPLSALDPHDGGSGSTRCRRSRSGGGRSSSTAPARR